MYVYWYQQFHKSGKNDTHWAGLSWPWETARQKYGANWLKDSHLGIIQNVRHWHGITSYVMVLNLGYMTVNDDSDVPMQLFKRLGGGGGGGGLVGDEVRDEPCCHHCIIYYIIYYTIYNITKHSTCFGVKAAYHQLRLI